MQFSFYVALKLCFTINDTWSIAMMYLNVLLTAFKNEKKRVEALQKLLADLPNCNRMLLSWIFVHMLHVVNLVSDFHLKLF